MMFAAIKSGVTFAQRRQPQGKLRMTQFKTMLSVFCLLLVSSCAQEPQRQHSARTEQQIAITPVLYYTERIADRLFQDLGPIPDGTIAVVSFTELKSLAPDPYNL